MASIFWTQKLEHLSQDMGWAKEGFYGKSFWERILNRYIVLNGFNCSALLSS